jgi:hypothetical protein
MIGKTVHTTFSPDVRLRDAIVDNDTGINLFTCAAAFWLMAQDYETQRKAIRKYKQFHKDPTLRFAHRQMSGSTCPSR